MSHPLIDRLFKKRGITKPEELTQEERETYNQWKSVLSKEELSIDDLKKFINHQIGVIEMKWKDLDLSIEKKAELIPYHTVYKTLHDVLLSPQKQREELERSLTRMIEL